MDPLAPFFAQFSLSARVFYSGRLCGASGDHSSAAAGHLHVLRQGKLRVSGPDGRTLTIRQPSVFFYPRPCRHRFRANKETGAELVCARIEFGAGMLNPLVQALPQMMVLPLHELAGLAPTVDLLFAEAFGNQPGRQTAVDRLTEYFIVLLLRAAMDAQLIQGGILMGLADPRLSKAIAAMHGQPERAWSLDALAGAARMSRARFAVHFRKIVGATPFDYLTDWRIGVAQSLLKRGEGLKLVAPTVGFSSSAALTRAFARRTGMTPTAWLAATHSVPESA
jgi:AraC-like DNA-binding protein